MMDYQKLFDGKTHEEAVEILRNIQGEREFLEQIIELAHLLQWRVAHFRPARTATGWRTPCQADAAGWPDLVLVKGNRLLFRELKTSTGKLTAAQRDWLAALEAAGQDAKVYRPGDWPDIERELRA